MVGGYIPDFVRPHSRPTFGGRIVALGALAGLRELTFLFQVNRIRYLQNCCSKWEG